MSNITNMDEMRERLDILRMANPAVDFEGRTDLFSSGDLDSMNIIMIASEINDRFDVELRAIDITPENFDSPDGILALIKRLKKEEA